MGPVFCAAHQVEHAESERRRRLEPGWLAEDLAGEAIDLFPYGFALPPPPFLPPEGR